MKRILALLLALALATAFVGCGKTAEDTTITGMVTAIDGTVISLMEMDGSSMGGKNFERGERPSRPENMEGFEGFEGMEGFEGGEFPWGEGWMPELPEGEMPERPEGAQRPDLPTGEDGKVEGFQPFGDGQMPDMGKLGEGMETTDIDIGNAHISLEEDGVKVGGSISDIKAGSFVTITRNAKGEVTNVLVTSGFGGMGSFGGMGGFGNFGDFGDFGSFGDQEEQSTQSE